MNDGKAIRFFRGRDGSSAAFLLCVLITEINLITRHGDEKEEKQAVEEEGAEQQRKKWKWKWLLRHGDIRQFN